MIIINNLILNVKVCYTVLTNQIMGYLVWWCLFDHCFLLFKRV